MAQGNKRRLRKRKSVNYVDDELDLLKFDIPHYNDAFKRDNIGSSNSNSSEIKGVEAGNLILASLPFMDEETNDYQAKAMFADEPGVIYNVKATNIMEDCPDYLEHVQHKSLKHQWVQGAIKAYKNIRKKEKKQKKENKHKKVKREKKKNQDEEDKQNEAKIRRVCIFMHVFVAFIIADSLIDV